jgi:glycosyltransferase involved in cell wall biosynthesis
VKYHILFIAYQTDLSSNGGMESATQIFEALSDNFYWTLMTNRKTSRTARWKVGGARVIYFAFNEKAGKTLRGAQLSLAALRTLTLRADIMHGNDIRSVQILLPAARLRSAPLALTIRGTKLEGDSYGAHWHHVVQHLNTLITLSNDMSQRIRDRLLVPAAKQKTINSIVDLDMFRPLGPDHRATQRARLGIGAKECAIGMIACVEDIKRQLEVIREVIPQLADLSVRLHLVGDFCPQSNIYARACADMVAAQGLEDRVVFHGFRSDVADWLAALDITLVASRREGLARCMIEAMACGTPVVSVDVCSAREMLVPTGAGIVVGINDWPGLTVALRSLCNDSDSRVAMGQAGRKAALAQFSTQRVAQQWRDLYVRLCETSIEK